MRAIIPTQEFEQWWKQCQDALVSIMPVHKDSFIFGEKIINIDFYQHDNQFFTEAIAHLALLRRENADFMIKVIDASLSGIVIPIAILKNHHELLARNHYALSQDGNFVLHYQLENELIYIKLINKAAKTAFVWCNSQQLIPKWERSFPFRQILHDFFAGSNYCLIHGAVVGIDGNGVLITAKGGSGKSTAALSCLSNGLQYVGDDFVLLDLATNYAYSLYNVAKLVPEQLARFPQFATQVKTKDIDMEKQQIFLFPKYKKQLATKLKLKAIITPKYDKDALTSELLPASYQETMLAMAPSTIFLLKSEPGVFKQLGQFCQTLPNYKLITASNLASIAERVKSLL